MLCPPCRSFLTNAPNAKRAAGTTDDAARTLVVPLVVNVGNRSTLGANAGNSAERLEAAGIAVSATVDVSCGLLASGVKLRALGLEPKTYGLKGRCSTN